MDNLTQKEFGEYFLLEFTRELIRNSASIDIYKLNRLINQKEERIKEEEIKEKKSIKKFEVAERKIIQELKTEEKKSIKELIKEKIGQRERYLSSIKSEGEGTFSKEKNPFINESYKNVIKKDLPGRTLFIPEPMLPENLRYLRPIPTRDEIDLGNINTLIQDPVVRVIECHGPNKEIVIAGVMGTKQTNLTLTEEEIEKIIEKFSKQTKIPLEEGFFKAVSGKLIISAIYSKSLESKFIIKKIQLPKKNYFLQPKKR